MEKLNWSQGRRALLAGIRAGVAVRLEGPPGCGKTSLVRAVGREVERPVLEIIGSTRDATDFGGLLFRRSDDTVGRSLIAELRQAISEPVILFLDEYSTAPPSVRAAMMRLVLERNVDGQPLHPDTRIVIACNPSDQVANATDLDAATGNRMSSVYFTPTIAEVAGYFAGVADPLWCDNALDFAATLAVDPSLVTFEPPTASVETGAAFASSRGWELALRIWSADGSQLDDAAFAMIAGCVGEAAAIAYLAIRKLREHLPTVAQIEADPATAPVPDRPDYQIATVGLIAAVARADKHAAWIYAERLRPEIGAALAQIITPISCHKKGSPHTAAGTKAQIRLIAKLHKATH